MAIKILIMRLIGAVSPKLITKILYKKTFGTSLDLKTPRTLNEKIHWMKFYGDTSQWPLMSDKYRVREYVKNKGLGHILVELYGVWDNARYIDWEKLPNKFVLKANNGCGDVTICRDKSKLDKGTLIEYYNRLLKEHFGIQIGQVHYRYIKPCIIAEELLDASKQQISSTSLIDYKIWCFNGNPHYIFVYLNREKGAAECMVYDVNWTPHPEYLIPTRHFAVYQDTIPRPDTLDEMLKIARLLSEGNPEMRVDLYEVAGKVYFGELTLTAAGGFMSHFTKEFLDILGTMVVLPIDSTICRKY